MASGAVVLSVAFRWTRERAFARLAAVVALVAPAAFPGSVAHAPAGSLPGDDWWSRAAAAAASEEYAVTWQNDTALGDPGGAWQAPNRAQGFRTVFSARGILVVPRSGTASPWRWGLALAGHGRGARIDPVPAAVLRAHGNRIDLDRGPIVEWYLNDARGLEQGFTLAAPPPGDDRREELVLVLELEGTLSPSVAADGQAIEFRGAGGPPRLRYAALAAHDARGRLLPARMATTAATTATGDRPAILLLIDDRDAVYPLTIDPLATSPSWNAESNQASARFGAALATAGDVNGDGFSDVIVGAPLYDNGQADEGRVFVYHGSASGLSTVASWTAEGEQVGARFGAAVATAGDVNGDGYSDVIVGAPLIDNGQADEGRAVVYHGGVGGLALAPAWVAESNQVGAQFGFSVFTAADVNGDGFDDVVVGAPLFDDPEIDEGAAFVYHGSAAGLSLGFSALLERNQAGAQVGYAVAMGGDITGDGYGDLLVGAPYYDYNYTDEGSVWVYRGSASGLDIWSPRGFIGGQAGGHMGSAVAPAGDRDGDGFAEALYGAPQWDEPEIDEGMVGTINGDSTGGHWGAQEWFADQAGAELGTAVSTAGDVNGDGFPDFLLAAPKYDGGQTDEGKVILIYGSHPGIVQWSLEGDQANAHLGQAVALAGDVDGDGLSDILVGAPDHDNGQTDEGRALLYRGGTDALVDPVTTREADLGTAQFAAALAMVGDVDGDGYGDLLVGAPYYDGGQTDEGRALLYRGGPGGLEATASWTVESNQANARFGQAVGGAGDVNGDGFTDLVVGAPAYDNGQTDEGRAFVYHGSASGPAGSAAFTFECNQASAQCGHAVAGAGDVNGDGFADVIVGAPYYDGGQTDEGRAHVFHGSATGLAATAAWTVESNQATARYGWSVASAGDVNRDGFSDVAVAAPYYDNGQTDEGRAFVYHGSASGLATTANWTAEGNQVEVSPAPAFGYAVAGAGDVNGDGYADLLVGAPYYDAGEDNEGRVFLYYGSVAGLAATAGWTTESEQNGGQLGFAVSSAGDVNGDGFADVVAGGNLFDGGSPKITSSGMVVVCYGSATGPRPAEWDFFTWSDQANARLGQAVAGGGDLNGDGFGDVVAGAPLYDAGQSDEGRLSFYRGGGWGSDTALVLRQRRASDAAPIAPLGVSDSASGFRLALSARSPLGPTRLALEWEVKPLGTAFNGTGLGRGAWVESWDDPSGRAAVSELVSGLTAATPYHWRVRLRYQAVTSPLQPHGRWIALPWKGWGEADLRTATASDADGDGRTSAVDCDDGNASVWSTPGEARELRLGPATSALAWSAPLDPGGTLSALSYDTIRSSVASNFGAGATCVESDGGDTASADAAKPSAGAGFFYLVRAQNACPSGMGPLGNRSDGTPRSARSCP